MYSVVFKLDFNDSCFLEGECYVPGEVEFFHVFLTADSLSIAYDRAMSYSVDHFVNFADVSIVSIIRLE